MNLVERVKNILLTPKTEWPVIAAEATDVKSLYINYIVILAAIPAVAGILGLLIMHFAVAAVGYAIVQYILTLIMVFLVALLIDALAPTFGGQKSQINALKLVAYSATAGWVASVFLVIPMLGAIIALIASLYGIYLLYLGLPVMMKCPQEKVIPYLVVTIVIWILLSWVFMALIAGRALGPMMMR
jgi:hypothetical protein